MNYSTAKQVRAILLTGAAVSHVSYRTRSWDETTINAAAFDQVWIQFEDGRKRRLFKGEYKELMRLRNQVKIRVTNKRLEDV